MKNIAIIGAGLAGISCAKALKATHNITVFEKSRGVSGRMSTCYAGDYEFDHGAQFFTARDPKFRELILQAVGRGEIAPWIGQALYKKDGLYEPDTGSARFVGIPRMNSFVKYLATGLDIRLGGRILSLKLEGGKWLLSDENSFEHGPYDEVVLAVPAPQAMALLPDDFTYLSEVNAVKMDVCFALMLGFKKKLKLDWTSLRLNHPLISWMAVNSSKPDRGENETLVIHTAAGWSNAHADDDRGWIEQNILQAATDILGFDVSHNRHSGLHRWLYASSSTSPKRAHLRDAEMGLSVCGDWCLGGRVENAYLSGTAAAEAILSAE